MIIDLKYTHFFDEESIMSMTHSILVFIIHEYKTTFFDGHDKKQNGF